MNSRNSFDLKALEIELEYAKGFIARLLEKNQSLVERLTADKPSREDLIKSNDELVKRLSDAQAMILALKSEIFNLEKRATPVENHDRLPQVRKMLKNNEFGNPSLGMVSNCAWMADEIDALRAEVRKMVESGAVHFDRGVVKRAQEAAKA